MAEAKVECRTPNPGKPGVTNIPKWKFDLVRSAILAELKKGDVPFSELSGRVGARLTDEDKSRLGSLGWHVTTVKLELEVRGEIGRADDKGPQIVTLR